MRELVFTVVLAAALECAAATATGFFRFETLDGSDRAIDPDGRAIMLAGVDFVNPDVFHSTFLGYAPYARFVATNYPSRQAWAEETAARLRDWGFNMLASHCATELFPGFPHADTLNLNNPFAKSKDPEWRIAENTDAPSTGFPNVFHPDYEKAVFAAAAKRCTPFKDDPSLVGWFIDNELAWWGRGSDPGTGLFDLAARLPPEHSARKALDDCLAEGGDAVAFLRRIAERYFSVNCAAIRAADPNHAVLGCRFAGGTLKTHDVVWEAAGKYCDAVSLNCYPWCDLDRGVVFTDQGGLPVIDEFRRVHALCGRPMLVTEWSFPALDAGRPCLHGAGQRFHTQEERAKAVELFARTILSEPYMVGYNWFMWVDQPAAGLRPALPEDSNYGLVGEDGRPYTLVTEAFTRVNREAAAFRMARPSEEFSGPAGLSGPADLSDTRKLFFSQTLRRGAALRPQNGHVSGEAALHAVAFAREGDAWSLSNGLVRLSGRMGGAFMADEVAFGGNPPAGRFRTLLQWSDGTRRLWTDADRVTDVAFSLDEATGIGTVTIRAAGGAADTSRAMADAGPLPPSAKREPLFAMTARLSLAPGCDEVLAEIVSAENLGAAPLRVERVFLRPYAAAAKPEGVPTVPKLWKGPHEGWWRLPDGRCFGAVSCDASSCSFRFYVDRKGAQHPDAPFVEDGPFAIPPGASWRPSSPMGALLKAEDVEAR